MEGAHNKARNGHEGGGGGGGGNDNYTINEEREGAATTAAAATIYDYVSFPSHTNTFTCQFPYILRHHHTYKPYSEGIIHTIITINITNVLTINQYDPDNIMSDNNQAQAQVQVQVPSSPTLKWDGGVFREQQQGKFDPADVIGWGQTRTICR